MNGCRLLVRVEAMAPSRIRSLLESLVRRPATICYAGKAERP